MSPPGAAQSRCRSGAPRASGVVVIGLQGGRTAEIDLGAMLVKRCALIATTLRARPADEKAAIVAAVREHVWPLIVAGESQLAALQKSYGECSPRAGVSPAVVRGPPRTSTVLPA